jgi:GNAT superfamily N-acetyltransferase
MASNSAKYSSRVSGSESLLQAPVKTAIPRRAPTGRPDYERAVSGLYVLPSMQRIGVGRALLDYVAAELARIGVDTLLIGCVRENPSCEFYRRLGGVEVFRQPQQVDRFETEEIFFGWLTLRDLRLPSGPDLSA